MGEVWQRVPGNTLLVLLNVFTAIALVFEGYNQGMKASGHRLEELT